MTSRKSLVTTVTVTMTTTTTTPLLEIDNGNDLQESQKKTNNTPTALQRHFVYEPPPKLPVETRVQEEQHGSLKWSTRSQNEQQDHQYAVQKQHSRWPSEDNQSSYSKSIPGSHIQNNNNNIGSNMISTSHNNGRTFVDNNNGNYYNTNYSKDYDNLLRDQFVEHHFIGSLSPSSPSPLLMMVREGGGGGGEELSDISGRGLKYPPPRRDSDGHVLGSANYSAPSPPERDLTLPYSSETVAWKKEKKLSPLSCEPHKDGSVWKEVFDSDPYMPTNARLSTAMNAPVWIEDTEIISEKYSLPNIGYLSKVVGDSPVINERNSKSLCNNATNRLYIVKPKPFYNTSTQTEETEVGYDSQLQFTVEANSCVSSVIPSMQSNLGIHSDQTCLEKATQVQLPKTNFEGSRLVTLEQLRSPNHKEFIPASAPLLRRLTEEYYQMNINEDNKNELIMHDQETNFDIDENAVNKNKFDLHLKKKAVTNNANQEHKQSFMTKTIAHSNEPLQVCMDKMSKATSVNESILNVNEHMLPNISIKMDSINMSNFNEADTTIYNYESQLKPSIIKKKTSVRVNRPQPQFTSDIKVDSTIKEQSFSVEEPRLQPFVGIKKSSLNINEYSMTGLQPQTLSYKDTDMQNLNASVSQPNISKKVKSSFNIKENQLQSYRGEPDYMNISEQVTDCHIPKMIDIVDDVFTEPKGLSKQGKSDSRSSGQRQGVNVGFLGKTSEIPDPFKLQPMRTDSSNLKSGVESAQITEGNFVNTEIRHGSNPESLFRQKDNAEPSVNQNASSRSMKDRHKLHPETLLNQTSENVFSQSTESNCESSECRYGTKFENLLTQTREATKSPVLKKKYASTSDILLGQTAVKNPPINSRNSVGRYENVFNQTRENIFMQKTVPGNLENRYGSSSCEKIGNQSKLSRNNLGVNSESIISKYSQSHLGSVPDVLNILNIARDESQMVKSNSLNETSKQTAEAEKYSMQGFNTTKGSSMQQETFDNTTKGSSMQQGTFDDTTKGSSMQQGTFDNTAKRSAMQQGIFDNKSKSFENQSFIQHGRSESLPIDYTYESPCLHLRSYYSCTDVNKENRLSEPKCIYGVSDYMDMSGRHHTERSQISSQITENTTRSDSFVPTKTKKKRTSSCTGYRIHANLESEEDPPPQLPPRAYRNMPESSSDNLSWIYESHRHRRSYANELRKQARRLNICKPLANITEAHVTDINQPFSGRDYVDKTNAVEKEIRKEKPKIPNKNLNHDQNDMKAIEISEDFKTDSEIKDIDMTNFTNIDEVKVKCQQVDEDSINHVSDITEHSLNNESYPNINKTSLNSNDILSSNVSQQLVNLDRQYLDNNQSTVTNKTVPIDNSTTNTSDEYKHSDITDIDDIKDSYESRMSPKEYDTDITNISVRTFESVLQNEHNLNDSFEPNKPIKEEQELHSVNEDFNMDKTNQMYLNESCSLTYNTNIDESVNSKKCVLYINENSEDIDEEDPTIKKEFVQLESPADLSQSLSSKSTQPVTSPSEPKLFIPSPTFQYSILKMPSFQSSTNRMQFQHRSSSEQCLTSIGSCNNQANIPLYVSLGNIPTEEASFTSAVDKQHIDIVSVKQRIHFFEYDSNGHLVRNRIPPPVPAKPTSLLLRNQFPKEDGFLPTQTSPETDPSSARKIFNVFMDNPSESSVNVMNTDEEKSEEDNNNGMEYVQYNIKDNMDIAAPDTITSLILPKAEEVTNNLEYFQSSHVFQVDHIDKDVLIRKKNALHDSLRRKLDVLSEAKLNVEAEIQEIDVMKKNICSQFENVCPKLNERRKLMAFFKDREMCQVLLSKLKIRITRLKNEMEETKPNHDLTDKLLKLQTQYSEAEQLSSDIDARQNSLVRLIEKYLTESNLSDFNYLLTMRPRLVAEMFELKEKIYNGGEKLIELERVPYK